MDTFFQTAKTIAEVALEDALDAGEFASVDDLREYALDLVYEQASSAHVYHSQALQALDEIAGDNETWDASEDALTPMQGETMLDLIHDFVAYATEYKAQQYLHEIIDALDTEAA